MRVAIIAPPWLALPIKGYGGIELVLEGLINGLVSSGIEVEVFGNEARKMDGIITHSLYKTEQYLNIHRPMYESLPILAAHMEYALTKIKADGKFDIIHDHNGFFGPELLAWATYDKSLPPVVHTLHGPPFSNQAMLDQGLPDNRPFWDQLAKNMGRMYIIGISNTLMDPASNELRKHILPTVYNAIEIENFPFVKQKKDYFMTLARFSRDKGQHIAVELCVKKGLRLRMAGTINGIETNKRLLLELANPLSSFRSCDDFRYYSDKILPYTVKYKNITYSGNLSGAAKMKFVSESKALLFPIDWEEPFGMAVIEALACGTPVIAMNRGAMSEIIEHGVNGFLANNEQEFEEYIDRIDEIDPVVCRKSVENKFSATTMAAEYVKRYQQAIRLNGKSI
jgi:glycosyltransferase involved in cell wall biosynthesis